jgi:hypothetical protein
MTDAKSGQHQPPVDTHGAEYRQTLFMFALLIIGFILVCCASPLGKFLTWREVEPNSYTWSPEALIETTTTLRVLGGMAFMAGLVERIVMTIRYDK